MASSVVAAAPVVAPVSQRQQHARASMAARATPFVGARPQQQRARQAVAAQRCARVVVAAAAQAEVGKLISKVEIPAFIPRQDIVDQLLRWAMIEVQENGVANCSTPCKVRAAPGASSSLAAAAARRPPPPHTCRLPLLPPPQVTTVRRDGELWGFTVSFLKDGESAADVRVAFDEEVTLKHEWVGRGAGLLPSASLPAPPSVVEAAQRVPPRASR